MTKEQAKILLTGAKQHLHPVRGMGYTMGDGSWMTVPEYEKLRVSHMLVVLGLRKEI